MKIQFKDNVFNKGDIIISSATAGSNSQPAEFLVVKSYKIRWWKKAISWTINKFGLHKTWFIGVKVEPLSFTKVEFERKIYE